MEAIGLSQQPKSKQMLSNVRCCLIVRKDNFMIFDNGVALNLMIGNINSHFKIRQTKKGCWWHRQPIQMRCVERQNVSMSAVVRSEEKQVIDRMRLQQCLTAVPLTFRNFQSILRSYNTVEVFVVALRISILQTKC